MLPACPASSRSLVTIQLQAQHASERDRKRGSLLINISCRLPRPCVWQRANNLFICMKGAYKQEKSTVTVFWQDPTHVLVYQRGGLVLLFLNGPWTTFEESPLFFFATFQHERRLEGQHSIVASLLGKKNSHNVQLDLRWLSPAAW